MASHHTETYRHAGEETLRRLYVYNGGFLTQPRLRQILRLAGYRVTLGRPTEQDWVGVWGRSPTAYRGEAMAARAGARLLRIEDAFLRSLHPGRAGEPPMGLLLDTSGVHFDASAPSDLETLLNTVALDDTALLNTARDSMAWMVGAKLSKYSGFDPAAPVPAPGYVLVIDQTRGDASVTASGGDRARFLEMLAFAQEEHPGARIVIKTHPETSAGFRAGHYRSEDATGRITLCDAPVSPWALLEGAVAVYTLSSQMGFEAILAGHKPRVFGTPFYAGWGLTQDEAHLPRRTRQLTRAQLFAGAMILAPVWIDPYNGTRASLETVLAALEAHSRSWQDDHQGWTAYGMRLWKRPRLQAMFGRHRPMRFVASAAAAHRRGTPVMAWGSKAEDSQTTRLEDGFLRSRGLGARLVPPLSLALDRSGIYYDPTGPSDLETLIAQSPGLRPDQIDRARKLRKTLVRSRVTKYNLDTGAVLPDVPKSDSSMVLLVPGQVEDDASLTLGGHEVVTNAGLLAAARAAHPEATLLYKPHPDVVAGLRPGAVDNALDWADHVLPDTDILSLIDGATAVWTMTSLTGFEALLRGCSVTTLGRPFYGGWGLTRDLAPQPERRTSVRGVTLDGLVYASLIAYPRYFDPVTRQPCPVEVAVDRLISGAGAKPGVGMRGLSKLQGLFASQAWLWRR